ncbi:hypothetical protein [uncultured Microscilla sp.]|uniref:hypothetical protein n=1 Tax=uncultured Microscilla sp. TaxID=432653 RepID=UPI0026284869|nr:hypothetical protein [uncultured Microscilla sp.]
MGKGKPTGTQLARRERRGEQDPHAQFSRIETKAEKREKKQKIDADARENLQRLQQERVASQETKGRDETRREELLDRRGLGRLESRKKREIEELESSSGGQEKLEVKDRERIRKEEKRERDELDELRKKNELAALQREENGMFDQVNALVIEILTGDGDEVSKQKAIDQAYNEVFKEFHKREFDRAWRRQQWDEVSKAQFKNGVDKEQDIQEFIDYLNNPKSNFSLDGRSKQGRKFKTNSWDIMQELINARVIQNQTGIQFFPGGKGHPLLSESTPDYFLINPFTSEYIGIGDVVSSKNGETQDILNKVAEKVRKYTNDAPNNPPKISVVVNLPIRKDDEEIEALKQAIRDQKINTKKGETKPAQVFLVSGNQVEVVDFQSEGAEGSSPPATEEA